MHTHIYMYTYTYVYIYIYICAWVFMCIYVCVCACMYMCMYMYIYILQQFLFNVCRFLINVVKLCKPLSKLDLPTLRKGSTEEMHFLLFCCWSERCSLHAVALLDPIWIDKWHQLFPAHWKMGPSPVFGPAGHWNPQSGWHYSY